MPELLIRGGLMHRDAMVKKSGSAKRGSRARTASQGDSPEQRQIARLKAQLKRARAEIAELEERADTDALLVLVNRRGFERDLKRAIAFVTRYHVEAAVVFLDVDRLKPVNDRYGHAAGDALLKAVAAALTGSVRASDIVARLGGDEFAVLMWNLTEDDAAKRAAVLEHTIDTTTLTFEGQAITAAASAGFTMIGVGDSPDDVLARADRAMYARKTERRAIYGAVHDDVRNGSKNRKSKKPGNRRAR